MTCLLPVVFTEVLSFCVWYFQALTFPLETRGPDWCGPQTERLLVRFPVRAHAWVAGQVSGWGRERGNHTVMLLSHIDVSLFVFLPFLPLSLK